MTLPKLSPAQYRRITVAALVMLSFIIVTGGAVRLTGSGLGCSDWPTCEQNQLVAELGDLHAMIEFVNRAITGLVSLVVVAAVLGSTRRAPRRDDLVRWSWGLVLGVIAQIILGALVVREHLPPVLVSGHFLLSMVLVWNAMVLRHRARMADHQPVRRELRQFSTYVRALSFVAAIVLVTGTIVTGTGPHSGSETQETKDALSAQGVDVAGLSAEDLEVERLPFDLVSVARIHASAVLVLLAGSVLLALRLRRPDAPADLFVRSQTLIAMLVVQGAIGYAQYFSNVPPLLVGIHIAGSIALWIAVLNLHLQVKYPVGLDDASSHPELANA